MQQSLLNDEKEALAELERLYKKALKDIGDKVKAFAYDISVLDAALEEEGLDDAERKRLQSRRQAKVYQKQYQDALQGQISDVVDKLHADEYETLHGYLTECYDNAFMGTLYNIQKQGIPLMLPIDQTAAVRAVLLNSKLSAGLYARLGIDLQQMKADVSREVTRGIAANMQYRDIARNIKNVSGVTMGRGRLIARTEGHRIQQQSNYDAQQRAKGIGADVVKQWDATLDSRTRESHAAVDGEIREIDKPFSNGLMFPGDPAGAAAEVCNCRCTSNTRAKWALSAEQTKWLGDVSEMTDKQKEQIAGKLGIPADELDNYSKTIVPLNAKGFDDFKSKYKALQNPEDERIIREAEERIAGYKARKKKPGATAVQEEEPAFVSRFKPAQTMQEAEKYAEQFVSSYKSKYSGNVSFKGMDLEQANKVNKVLTDTYDRFDVDKLSNVTTMNFRESKWKSAVEDGVAGAYQWGGNGGTLYMNQKIFANEKTVTAFAKKADDLLQSVLTNADDILKMPNLKEQQRKYVEALKKSGVQCISQKVGDFTEATFVHEMGHSLDDKIFRKQFKSVMNKNGFDIAASMEKYASGISGYATSKADEYVAESFTAWWYGLTDVVDPDLAKIFKNSQKSAKTLEKIAKGDIIKSGTSYAMIIPDEKFTKYALDPLKDKNKATAFELALGYNQSNYKDLKQNILDHVDESKLVAKDDVGYGMRYEYVVSLTGANGKKANVLTAWIQDGTDKRLTSAYVTDKEVTK